MPVKGNIYHCTLACVDRRSWSPVGHVSKLGILRTEQRVSGRNFNEFRKDFGGFRGFQKGIGLGFGGFHVTNRGISRGFRGIREV